MYIGLYYALVLSNLLSVPFGPTTYFRLLLNRPILSAGSQNLKIAAARRFAGRMPFLSPNQQCQSTEIPKVKNGSS